MWKSVFCSCYKKPSCTNPLQKCLKILRLLWMHFLKQQTQQHYQYLGTNSLKAQLIYLTTTIYSCPLCWNNISYCAVNFMTYNHPDADKVKNAITVMTVPRDLQSSSASKIICLLNLKSRLWLSVSLVLQNKLTQN